MNKVVNIFRKNREAILGSWLDLQLVDNPLRENMFTRDDLKEDSDEFFDSLLDNLTEENLNSTDERSFLSAREILSGISAVRSRKGFSAQETVFYILNLKQTLLSVLKREILDLEELHEQSRKISKLIDSFGVLSFESYIKERENTILRQKTDLDEISTPVLKVWDGILAMPIIGTLDSARAEIVMESLLEQVAKTGYNVVIIDISGVPAVDSMVADHLIKTVTALKLMGARCIISGIRPEIAQSIVQLGIDLSGIMTKATLATALKSAFDILKLQVLKK